MLPPKEYVKNFKKDFDGIVEGEVYGYNIFFTSDETTQ